MHYVSQRLRQASIQITLDLYAHRVPCTEHEDAEVFEAIMRTAERALAKRRDQMETNAAPQADVPQS